MNKGTAVWTVAVIGVAPRRCRARRAAKEAGHEVRSIHSVKSLKRNIGWQGG